MRPILLVEDKVDNLLVIEDIFEFDDVGAQLVVATSGEEALLRVCEIRPSLILMDLGLPGISGIDTAKRLKIDPATQHIPIWALTAHAMGDIRREALAAGCDEYVTKPINVPEMAERLRRFVRAERAEKTA